MTACLLTAGLVLPTGSGRAVPDGAVLVRDGLIEAVGPVASMSVPADVVRWDFPDGVILPGLIDTHVHFVFDASDDPVTPLLAVDDETLYEQMAGRARQLLDAGVTTVRDLGDRANLACTLRDAVNRGELPGPRILAAGAPLTVPGGHCWFLGGEAGGDEQIRKVLRRNLDRGADVVKVMVTGGTLTPGGPPRWQQQFTDAEIALIVAEAHRKGRLVAGHVHGVEGVRTSLAAGVDTLEHCTFASAQGLAVGPTEEQDELIGQIADSGTFVCPTLSGGLDDHLAAVGMEVVDRVLDLVRRQHGRGVRLVVGTDAGMRGSRFDRYAGALPWYEKAGLSKESVLDAATVVAAEALGLGNRTGRLAEGLSADLLVVDGDPRVNLDVLRRPALVLAAGRPHKPEPIQ